MMKAFAANVSSSCSSSSSGFLVQDVVDVKLVNAVSAIPVIDPAPDTGAAFADVRSRYTAFRSRRSTAAAA
jgi:hypothetical protein